MNNQGIIYKYENKLNGKIYIGQTTTSLEERLRGHLKSRQGCRAIDSALRQYGVDNFDISIIEKCNSTEELNKKEQFWINYYNSNVRGIGYNLTSGGDNGEKTQEARDNMSISAKKRCTDEWRKRQSKLCVERYRDKNNNPFYGKHHTEESKKIISIKASKRQLGINNPFYGKHHSDESKRKMSETKTGMFTFGKNPSAKRVLCIETNKIYSCSREASIELGMHPNSLSTLIRRNGGRAKGYHFIYV